MWSQHYKAFSKFICKKSIPKSVLELGGGHGELSVIFNDSCTENNIPWTIVEPTPVPVPKCRAEYIKIFFDKDFECEIDYDTIIHSNFLEHVYDLQEFFVKIKQLLSTKSHMIFCIPDMGKSYENLYLNCLNFEHTFLLTEEYVDYLLSKYKLRIERKEHYQETLSIFYDVVPDDSVSVMNIPSMYQKNKIIFKNFLSYYEEFIVHVNDIINQTDRPVYIFGAHIFSLYLFAFGLNASKIHKILDNDVLKINRRLYGTSLIVDTPRCLANDKHPLVILKTGIHTAKIKKDIIENINNNVEFIE